MSRTDASLPVAPADPRGGHAILDEGMKDAGHGQRHNRIERLEETSETPNVEITLGQKMLSAVSGSVFTSLLGIMIFQACIATAC